MTVLKQQLWTAISPLLDRALDMTQPEREAWLSEMEQTSQTLVDEIRAVLSGATAVSRDGFLDPSGPDAVMSRLPSLAGQSVGAYTLDAPIGHGGMGTVWRAHRSDGRYQGSVAIKFLNLALIGRVGEQRFTHEGTVLAKLAHPNIARLLDAGVSAGGQPYLVLDYVEGARIDRYCSEHNLGVHDRLRLVGQVLDAVAHAHANLVVHRDLKPSNILVTAAGEVKLLDFGIAKLLESGFDRADLTAAGGSALTPEYAAPEQVAGAPITTATDVYSLGVLLYVLLSGRHPTGPGATSVADHLRGILEVEPPSLPLGDLDTIVSKALKKAPAERYPSVTALADDLVRYQSHEPVTARPDSWAYRTAKFIRRHRLAVVVAAVVFGVLVTATVVTRRQIAVARQERDYALYETNRAEALREFQSLMMSQAGAKPTTMRELLDKGQALLQGQFGTDRRVVIPMLAELGTRYGEIGDEKTQATLMARADSLAAADEDETVLWALDCPFAEDLIDEGKLAEARVRLDRAIAGFRTAPRRNLRQDASCAMIKAKLYQALAQPDSAVVEGAKGISFLEDAQVTRSLQYAAALHIYAAVLEEAGQIRPALSVRQRAVAALDSIGRGETTSMMALLAGIAGTLQNLGEIVTARATARQAILRTAGTDSTPIHPVLAINMGGMAAIGGEPDSAAYWYGRAAEQARRLGQVDWLFIGLSGEARALFRARRLAEGRAVMAEALRVNASRPQAKPRDRLLLEAWAASGAGDHAASYQKFRELLETDGYFAQKRRPGVEMTLTLAATEALANQLPDTALRFARDAVAVARVDSLAATRSAYIGAPQLVIARALRAKGEVAAARAAADSAFRALSFGLGPEASLTKEAEQLVEELNRR